MAQNQKPKFVPNYRFVDAINSKYGRSDQSHVQRESARMQQWERRKDLIGSISTPGELPWTRRSTGSPTNTTLEMKEEHDSTADDGPCSAHSKASPSQTGVARGKPVIGQRAPGSGSSIVKLRLRCTDHFETSVIPMEGKSLDALLDFLHNRMISDLYETSTHEKNLLPMSRIAAFALQDAASSYALFSLTAFGQDATLKRPPGPEAIAYKVKAIQLVNNHLTKPGGVSDGTIMAVTILWQLEAHFDDFARYQVHVGGLQQMIQRRGGFDSLAEELLWVIAWCASSVPGSFALSQHGDGTSRKDAKPLVSVTNPSIAFDELLNTLATIHKLGKTDVPLRVFSNTMFSVLRTVLDRLIVSKYGDDDLFRNRAHLKSSCRLAVLLSIMIIFLEHRTATNEQRRAQIMRQLHDFQMRMLAHGLDRRGSVEKLWHVIMTKRSRTAVALEAREWQTVRLMNLAKQLSVGMMDNVADLLWAYLKEGTKWGRLDAMYADTVERIKGELQTL